MNSYFQVSKTVGKGASLLTQEDYSNERNRKHQYKARGAGEGVLLGIKGLGQGIAV
jgi:hypothetical protein